MAYINFENLNERYGHRESFIRKLMTMVEESHLETANKLAAAADDANMDDIIFLSHSMKGVAGSILADSVADFAKITEMQARRGDAAAAEMARDLADMVSGMIAEINAYLAS